MTHKEFAVTVCDQIEAVLRDQFPNIEKLTVKVVTEPCRFDHKVNVCLVCRRELSAVNFLGHNDHPTGKIELMFEIKE